MALRPLDPSVPQYVDAILAPLSLVLLLPVTFVWPEIFSRLALVFTGHPERVASMANLLGTVLVVVLYHVFREVLAAFPQPMSTADMPRIMRDVFLELHTRLCHQRVETVETSLQEKKKQSIHSFRA